MKKVYTFLILGLGFVLFQSGVQSSGVPPQGRTGASGSYCTGCHSSFALNTSGGGVTVTGLPTSGYVPGTSYPFSLTINHASADRKRWGFAIKAVNASGATVGTFSSTNGNAALNGTELAHQNAPVTTSASTYSFNNLKWTAPASASGNVRFFYCAVAGNNANQDNGDYVYSGLVTFSLPVKLSSFTATNDRGAVVLKWQTASEINSDFFEVERSDDGQFYQPLGKVSAGGNTSSAASYSFTDTKAASSGGNIFYRLKMVDRDGTTKYSSVVTIRPLNTTLNIRKAYPTVLHAGDAATMEITSEKARNAYATILDETGKVYGQQAIKLNEGFNNIQIKLPGNAAKGMLFIKMETDNFQQTASFIIQ